MDLKSSSITADILNILSDGKYHTMTDISNEVECSRRTVIRHIQSLSYRYPIETFKGGDLRGGVQLDKRYINNGKMLSITQLDLLNEALTLLSQQTNNDEKQSEIQKLIKHFSSTKD